ncbi:hypothetical protein C0993_003513 [Termitomyces sp. T159_Od127]|nr:hypothetical protein C0993_003513 [Termitomyces sp. T159_Od127]
MSQNLETKEELEEEDCAAQSVKLQELIRRGTPHDLAAAQELMKALARNSRGRTMLPRWPSCRNSYGGALPELMKALSGANPNAKPDYRTQALTKLSKLEQKGHLVERDA